MKMLMDHDQKSGCLNKNKNSDWFTFSNILKLDDQDKMIKMLKTIKFCKKIYDGSLDNDSPFGFHKNCDKFQGTLVILKSGESIVGGYNERNWKGFGYKKSWNSFLFSLNDMTSYSVINEEKAIYCTNNDFPCFGCLFMRWLNNESVF